VLEGALVGGGSAAIAAAAALVVTWGQTGGDPVRRPSLVQPFEEFIGQTLQQYGFETPTGNDANET
jgi:hypothetical protein